jgi:hypothetical protein
MLRPLIQRPQRSAEHRSRERGITLALVALAIVGIIAMAGLSIDIGTLYEASAEAQRAADAGALAGARFISMSGVTGDPTYSAANWQEVCNGLTSPASSAAIAVAHQNTIGGASTSTVTVTYSTALSATNPQDCSQLTAAFAVNPLITVQVTQSNLPTYFSRIWGRTGNTVSATATAEVFNPSNSGAYAGSMVPVQPRCVKPWIVPNRDPGNPTTDTCTGAGCNKFVSIVDGSIQDPGIEVNYVAPGVIGEKFTLVPDCSSAGGNCNSGPPFVSPPVVGPANFLQYLPGQVLGAPVAVPSCGTAGPYQQAVAGCDQSTPYQCGVLSASLGGNTSKVDLNENPGGPAGDTSTAAQCLIHQTGGQDTLVTTAFPYQIQPGAGNPLNLGSSTVITSSTSIVTLPIYDDTQPLGGGQEPDVTIVGFLQVFINQVNADGTLNVTVLNVAGCGNTVPSAGTTALAGTSPVPIRLITQP